MTSPSHRMIALTGGIGSGKSTVAQLFAQRGARIIDADILAREVVEPGQPALAEIAAFFGNGVIAADGTLNRKALGTIVFADPASREALERILHPRIRQAFDRAVAQDTSAELTIYVVPLFFESNNPHPDINGVIVVSATEEACLSRIMKRDDLNREQALARIRSQIPLAEKVALADWVVENNSTPEALIPQVENVYSGLRKAC